MPAASPGWQSCSRFGWRVHSVSYFGRKNYYLARKGEYLINPAAQQYIISQAEALGLRLDDYFDEYVERYDW